MSPAPDVDHVPAEIDDGPLPTPTHRRTPSRRYGLALDEDGTSAYLERIREPRDAVCTSEKAVLPSVGDDHSEREVVPHMVRHPSITVRLSAYIASVRSAQVVSTRPIVVYGGRRFWRLSDRSPGFERERVKTVAQTHPVPTVDHPNRDGCTRIPDSRYATGPAHAGMSIVWMHRQAMEAPYLAEEETGVTLAGSLAQCRYDNLEQVIARAVKANDDPIVRPVSRPISATKRSGPQ